MSAGCKVESGASLVAHLGTKEKGNLLVCGFRVKLLSSGLFWN